MTDSHNLSVAAVTQPGETIMVLEETGWRLCERERKCRFYVDGRGCGRPAVAEFLRGSGAGQWWAYCEDHLYGRVILDGEFWFVHEATWPWEFTYDH